MVESIIMSKTAKEMSAWLCTQILLGYEVRVVFQHKRHHEKLHVVTVLNRCHGMFPACYTLLLWSVPRR